MGTNSKSIPDDNGAAPNRCPNRAKRSRANGETIVIYRSGWYALVGSFVMLLAIGVASAADDTPITFDRDVAPLLARRCLDCHNGTEKKGELDLTRVETTTTGGESGVAIVAGKSNDSLLWQRVRDGEMPPKKPLPKDEVELLRRWVDGGAKWGTSPIDPFAFTIGSRAGYDWWSLQPVRRPDVPELKSQNSNLKSESSNPIDAFVLARLQQDSLSPSPQADRRTLIRRLSFDLIGLPPTLDEVTQFENDDSPQAYDKLVKRLLDSPHFGERWARHWLDIIRFGESQGFERDKLRTNSWRYRDWVVSAFNRDLPYDEFVRLQLAGDVLRPDDPNAIIATGFLVAGAYDEVGQSQQSAAMRAVVRQDELEDYVSTVGETFLGLTVHCARCHDHKFDPISQRDYYRMSAGLAGVRHGERAISNLKFQITDGTAQISDLKFEISNLKSDLSQLMERLAEIEADARKAILAERQAKFDKKVPPPMPIARWEFNGDLKDSVSELHGMAHNGAKLQEGFLRVNGRQQFVATVPLKTAIKAKTLEAWVRLDHFQQQGGGAISLQTLDGVTFDAIVFGEREPLRWMAGSNGFSRTNSFQGPEEAEADKQLIHVAIVYDADGTITGYRNGRTYGQPYKSSGPVTFETDAAQVVFGLRHGPAGGNKHLAAAIDRAALYDRALSAEEVAASAGVFSDSIAEPELLARLAERDRAERTQLKFEIDHLHKQLVRANETKVYAVAPRNPDPTFVLLRGSTTSPAEEVTAGGVVAVRGQKSEVSQTEMFDADFKLAKDASDADRRKALATWITDRQNPLLARVMVNRLWQYHFGAGLVETSSDFGFNGGRPSHPELLDWLAAELMDHGWSLKHIHRLIVTSATYQQSSRPRMDAAQKDAGNRLLWRKSPMRLEAETLRDAVLAVSGELNPVVGGPGYHDFTTFTFNSQFYEIVDAPGRSFARRSLYRTWVRSGRNPFLEVLDCPDPSTKTPRRAVTTTPLQALSLLNNSFIFRMSDRLAERVRSTAPNDEARQIDDLIRQVWGRPSSEVERNTLREFVTAHGLAALARVLLNSNEFVYVE